MANKNSSFRSEETINSLKNSALENIKFVENALNQLRSVIEKRKANETIHPALIEVAKAFLSKVQRDTDLLNGEVIAGIEETNQK